MLGRTHFSVGIAAALAVMQPDSMQVLLAGTGAAALGSIISDIDADTSEVHRGANRIIAASVLTAVIVAAADGVWHIGIAARILRDSSMQRIGAGLLAFLLICIIGKQTPHRSFMHSFLAMFLLGLAVNQIMPAVTPYFLIGFASHLALDLLNRKGEKLFFPLRKGFCLHLCSSHGIVNKWMGIAGTAASILLFLGSQPVVSLLQRQ